MKELAAPMVLNLIQSGNSSSDLAQRLSGYIDEESFSETRKSFETLKSLMSCYQCALLEVETKFKVLNERFSLNHDRNPIEMIKQG